MAQRFGGKYSPDGKGDAVSAERGAYQGAQVNPVGARANLLFIPAIPMVFLALNDGAVNLTLALVSAGILTLAAWLLRGGLVAEAAYAARKVARRPAIPRKLFSSALTGIGIAIAAYRVEPGLVAPLLFGVAACGLHLAAFGIDPLRDKGMEGVDTFQQDRVARVVDEAETHLTAMTDAMPRDLTAARKYLGVYLMGARDATIKFADIYSRSRDTQARADYSDLLDDLSDNFAARTRKLLVDDRSDLNIEIDVLRDRLQREGVRTPTNDQ